MKLRFGRTFKQQVIIDLLIQEIKESKHFDMRSITHSKSPVNTCQANDSHPCGTAACIAGHTAAIAAKLGDRAFLPLDNGEIRATLLIIADLLGLNKPGNSGKSADMFIPTGVFNYRATKGQKGYISKRRAVAMLEHFNKTNEVKWDL